jgi:hypothetical protein
VPSILPVVKQQRALAAIALAAVSLAPAILLMGSGAGARSVRSFGNDRVEH